MRWWLVFPCNASSTTITSTWWRRKCVSLAVVHEETQPQWDVGRTLGTPARNITEESPCHDLGSWVALGLQENLLNEYNSPRGLCLVSVIMKSAGLILLGCSSAPFWQCKWASAQRKYSTFLSLLSWPRWKSFSLEIKGRNHFWFQSSSGFCLYSKVAGTGICSVWGFWGRICRNSSGNEITAKR